MSDVYLLSDALKNEIDVWVAKFPADQKRSAVIPALTWVQDKEGYLSTPMMDAVADYLGMPPIGVYEVATFYSMYDLKPRGQHKICVCTNISCMLRGSEKVVDHLKKTLKIDFNETTEDKQFTLRHVECLGACGGAPAMQVDKTYYENLTPERIDEILAKTREGSC
ncbi:MAG: NADH-quinone oxidoreductase subunit NuoE [Gammaproteobacteria bacterium]